MALQVYPPAGDGDVVGPASATDGHLAVFDGTTGKLIKDGGAPAGGGDVTGPGSATDGHFAVFNGATGKVIKDGGDTAAKATNIAGGLGGQVPYQSAANTTALLANGTAGQVLTSNGTTLAPSWNVGIQIGTATVTTNLAGKQDLLTAVPVGKVRIVTQIIARNPSTDFGLNSDAVSFGYDAFAEGWYSNDIFIFEGLVVSNKYVVIGIFSGLGSNYPLLAGVAGEVFGMKIVDTSIVGTIDVDVQYYDIDA